MKKLILFLLFAVTVQAATTSNPISTYQNQTTISPLDHTIWNSYQGPGWKTKRADASTLAGYLDSLVNIPGPNAPQDIIFDCDPGNDVDDIGDLAVMHQLADQGEIRVLAVMSSLRQAWSAADIEVINRWFGRPNIPIGVPAVNVYAANDYYGSYLQNNFYNAIGDSANARESIALYRQILSARPASSVTLVFAGQLKNLADLWNSAADSYSLLTGSQLIQAKVKRIVVVAGVFPNSGTPEYNFATDPSHAAILNSITSGVPVSFMGIEQGNAVVIGGTIVSTRPALDPVREAYRVFYAGFGGTTRPAWASLGLLYAARGNTWRGTSQFTATKGFVTVNSTTGANTWVNNAGANQEYLTKAQADSYYINILDAMLVKGPLSENSHLFRTGDVLNVAGGSASAPSISFGSELNTGFYKEPAGALPGTVDFVGNGNDAVRLFPGGIALKYTNVLGWAQGGFTVTPADVFLGRSSANWLKITTALNVDPATAPAGNLWLSALKVQNGSTTTPSIHSATDTDTGLNSGGAFDGEWDWIANSTRTMRFSPMGSVVVTNAGYYFASGAIGVAGIDAGIMRDSAGVTKSVSSGAGALGAHRVTQLFVGSGGITISTGTGTPEAVVTAPVGSIFLRSDGGASTTFYVKQSGTGNTGWAAK